MRILAKGVAGDAASFYRWAKMLFNLSRLPLPDNFQEFSKDFTHDVSEALVGFSSTPNAHISQNEIKTVLDDLYSQNVIEIIQPFGEFRLRENKETLLSLTNEEGFFSCNDIMLQPLQYIRSRVAWFCERHNITQTGIDDIIISVTEAAENAIKYSDNYPIYVWHRLNNHTYDIRLYNSSPEVDLTSEIKRGKFSEDVSLMRGVLVMSKLLDNLEIIRNTQKHRVEFIGTKTVSFNND